MPRSPPRPSQDFTSGYRILLGQMVSAVTPSNADLWGAGSAHLRKHPHLDLFLLSVHRVGDSKVGSTVDDPCDETLRADNVEPLFWRQRQWEWEEHVHDRRVGDGLIGEVRPVCSSVEVDSTVGIPVSTLMDG